MLVFIAHGRRELVHVNVTANPTAAWVWRQLIEATPWGQKPRHLLRDRDAVYGHDFRQRARRIGIDAVTTPVRSPRANSIVEHVIGTLRRECVDHLIERCRELMPEKIIVIKGNVFDVTFTRLRDAGLPVINRRIPFPANGDELKFAGAFAQALKQPPPMPPQLSI